MQKLLRRPTPSTYNLKVKAKQKPITRRTSVSSLSSILEREHKDLLKGKSLEEIGRLGGLSILELNDDFAMGKLTLPTCISATAGYLYHHGAFLITVILRPQANDIIGCKAPGIFRISGQTTTINALYDYYAHRFANASNPELVQETVASCIFPSHITPTVHDVASVFKKIVAGLPGGLLGSLSLFAALRNIAQDLHHDPELSESEFINLRAKLVALAISSATSTFRVSLISAVLGLASYLGHDAELAISRSQEKDEPLPAELMNYQALGVVLGPLLLGELTCDAGMAVESRGAQIPVPKSSKKTRKEKQATVAPKKLEQIEDFLAQVEQAKSTAIIMQMLVSIWKDVVKQLREIDAARLLFSRLDKEQKLQSTQSRLTLRSSEEDSLLDILRARPLPDDWQGTVEIREKLRVPSKLPVVSRDIRSSESWPHERIEEQGNGSSEHTAETGPDRASPRPVQEKGHDSRGRILNAESAGYLSELSANVESNRDFSGQTVRSHPSSRPCRDFSGQTMQSKSSLVAERSEPKDKAFGDDNEVTDGSLEQMSKGTLSMRPPQIFGSTEWGRSLSRSLSDVDVPCPQHVEHQDNHSIHAHSEVTKGTEDHSLTGSEESATPKGMDLFLEPHPFIQATPLSSGVCSEDGVKQSGFPTRKSSLVQVRRMSFSNMLRTEANSRSTSNTQSSEKAYMPLTPEEVEERALDSDKISKESHRNSVKMLAQKFAEAERANRIEGQQKDANITKVFAYIDPLSTVDQAENREKGPQRASRYLEKKASMRPANIIIPGTLEKDIDIPPSPSQSQAQLAEKSSFTQRSSLSGRSSPEKETLIPKPLHELGHARQSSRSPSPTKSASLPKLPSLVKPLSPTKYVRKRPSVFSILHEDADPEVIQKEFQTRTPARTPTSPLFSLTDPELNRRGTGPRLTLRPPHTEDLAPPKSLPTRSLTAYSTESLRRLRAALEEPPVAIHVSRPVSPHPANQHKRYVDNSATTDDRLPFQRRDKRMSAGNGTLYAEIRRLQRQIDAKTEELSAVRRSLEAERAAAGVSDGEGKGKRKGQMGEEVREARREMEMWRGRAVWAEKRLEGMKVSVGVVYEGEADVGGDGAGDVWDWAGDERGEVEVD